MRGPNECALLESRPDDPPGLRDHALLSIAYDARLRASEMVAICVEHERAIGMLTYVGPLSSGALALSTESFHR